jgi:hypothetical protein
MKNGLGKNMTELLNRNSHNYKNHFVCLSSARDMDWSSEVLLGLDQCQEFWELEVKLPRFKRNVYSKCLHR